MVQKMGLYAYVRYIFLDISSFLLLSHKVLGQLQVGN